MAGGAGGYSRTFRVQLIDENLKLMNLEPMKRLPKVGEILDVPGFYGMVEKVKRDLSQQITYIYAER